MTKLPTSTSEAPAPSHSQPGVVSLSPVQWGGWAACLALLTLAAIGARTEIPLDETRYLAVAWEMWRRGDFLVPFLNGEPYSHKPPLLFWLVDLGWGLSGGPNAWWPRLIAPLLALANVWMTWRLAACLWPNRNDIRLFAPWVLLSMLIWLVYAQALMFDMLVATCALLGLNAIASGALRSSSHWWWGLGVSIGLGILAKGPAILVHVLPVALFAPWWAPIEQRKHWYVQLVLALLLGIVVALIWAIPAGQHGGSAYNQAIFWGQTAHRVVNSFAHKLPFWWYLAALPLLMFPWLAWPRVISQTSKHIRRNQQEVGVRFALIWALAAVLIFSAISGKQPHYILPEAPAFALLIAYGLSHQQDTYSRALVPALGLIVLGGLLTWKITFSGDASPPDIARLPGWAGAGFVFAGLVLLLRLRPVHQVYWVTGTMTGLVLWLLLVIFRPLAPAFDISPVAQALHRFEKEGRPIAHLGKYHGQFHFAGRLDHPIDVLSSEDALRRWATRHPQGIIILYGKEKHTARFSQAFRETQVGLFTVADALPLLSSQPHHSQRMSINNDENEH